MPPALVLLVACLCTGCLFGLPPTRTEIGRTASRDGGITRGSVGVHIGSLVPNQDTRIELGGGVLFESDPNPEDMVPAGRGGFADVGAVALRTTHTRMIVGARLDRYTRGAMAAALKLRVDLEAVGRGDSTFSETDSCGGMWGGSFGNMGIGAYAEAGPAWFADDTRGWTATFGANVRLPAWGFVAIGAGCGDGGSRRSRGSSSGSWRNRRS